MIAFVLRILTSNDGAALTIEATALERRRACLAKTRADVVTTDAIDTETARALICRRAARTKHDLALSQTITSARIAFVRRIRIRRNSDARTNVVLHVACLARSYARLIATNTVDTIAGRTVRIHHARKAVGQLARANAIA